MSLIVARLTQAFWHWQATTNLRQLEDSLDRKAVLFWRKTQVRRVVDTMCDRVVNAKTLKVSCAELAGFQFCCDKFTIVLFRGFISFSRRRYHNFESCGTYKNVRVFVLFCQEVTFSASDTKYEDTALYDNARLASVNYDFLLKNRGVPLVTQHDNCSF